MPPSPPPPLRGLILDMDGVLWRGSELLFDFPATFARIARLGWRFLLATNNATQTLAHYREKFAALGVSLEPWQVLNSAEATARYLEERFPAGGPVYVIGEPGLAATLQAHGFPHRENGSPLAVVAGMDRQLTYAKLSRATILIRAGVPFIGTNPDVSFPTPEGQTPGAGAILAALEAASGVHPTVIGKPHTALYRAALQALATAPHETLAVGDRLETDIAGGQAAGCRTGLVLSGVTTLAQARAWSPPPDWVAADLPRLLEIFEKPA